MAQQIVIIATTVALLIFLSIPRSSDAVERSVYLHPHDAWESASEIMRLAQQVRNDASSDYLKDIGSPQFVRSTMANAKLQTTDLCGNQSNHVLYSLGDKNPWAMQLLDAWAKPQSGFFDGNFNWLGDYDECVGIKSPYNKSQNSVLNFDAKYCTVTIPISITTGNQSMKIPLQYGVCVPDGCVDEDMVSLFQMVINNTAITAACQPKTKSLSTGTLTAIVLYSLIAAMCLMGTLYDMYYRMRPAQTCPKYEHLQPDHVLTNTPENDEFEASGTQMIDRQRQQGTAIVNPHEQGGLCKFMLCFSVYTNGYKMLGTSQPAEALHCLHGIRFISLSWVILGHTLVFSLSGVKNVPVILSWLQQWTFQAIINATVSVDSFFVLSGLLTSYLFLKDFSKRDITLRKFFLSVPVLYLHRYLRLTPALGFMLLGYMYLLYPTGDGPFYPLAQPTDPNCQNNSWAVMLYVNNVYDGGHECAAWSWYLANDFQFFLIAPFIIYLIYRYPAAGLPTALALVFASCITATVISFHHKFDMGFMQTNNGPDIQQAVTGSFFTDYYGAPWCRYQSFGVGILAGYVIWKCNGKLGMPWWANLVGWGVSAAVCLSVLYGPFGTSIYGADHHIATNTESAIYNGFSRAAWSVGLSYVIIACCTGNGGWVNELLSWSAFVPLSRMTYCAYLVHPVVMTYITFSERALSAYSHTVFVSMFASFMLLSYGLAFIFSLLFESPFLNLDKHYITGRLNKRT